MNSIAFTIPGPPRPKARPRLGRNGSTYTPDETRRYELHARTCALAARAKCGWNPSDREATYRVSLGMVFPNRRRMDLDNCAKAVLDAGNGMLWIDDAQVCELHVYRQYDADRPRVDVVVTRMETP